MQYTGSCHCQKVELVCEFELNQPAVCNCSYCSKRNAIMHVVDDIKIREGKNNLTCYQFNKMKGKHYFCQDCSIFIYCTPPEPVFPYVINLGILDDCDWQHLPLHHFDGKDL